MYDNLTIFVSYLSVQGTICVLGKSLYNSFSGIEIDHACVKRTAAKRVKIRALMDIGQTIKF